MMKKIFSLILALLTVAFCAVSCSKDTAEGENDETDKVEITADANEDYFTWNDTVITGYTEEGLEQKELVIPEKCTGFSVAALADNEVVEHIDFENSDTIFSDYLFQNCTSLKKINLPQNITEITTAAFDCCASLETISIPNTVKIIDEYAFSDCDSLTVVDMGNGVETIELGAFSFCENLTEIKFSELLITIGKDAFKGDAALSGEIVFPATLTSIGESAFYKCDYITSVTIPEGVTTLEYMSFMYCGSLEEIYLPASLEEIDITAITQLHGLDVYVKEGSFADTDFENYNNGAMTKLYY